MKIIDGKAEEYSVSAGILLLVDAVRYRFHTLIADKAKTFGVPE